VKRIAVAIAIAIASVLVVSSFATVVQADSPKTPVILAASVSTDGTTLFVTGSAFGTAPTVSLAGIVLGGVIVNGTGTQLTAIMPALPPGSYVLDVTSNAGGKKSDEFEMTLGANGPAGPAGPAGAVGPAGAAGPVGANGATGAQGAQGAAGPAGPQGPQGLQGPAGSAGANGATGAQGAAGPQGSQGPAGPSGVVANAFVSAFGMDPNGTLQFIGATVQVPLAANQKALITSSKALGSTVAGGASNLNLFICTQLGNGPMVSLGFGSFGMHVAQGERVEMTLSAITLAGQTGTYTMGLCGQTSDSNTNWNSNEYGYTTAIAFN
jgi:hypothetical protein